MLAYFCRNLGSFLPLWRRYVLTKVQSIDKSSYLITAIRGQCLKKNITPRWKAKNRYLLVTLCAVPFTKPTNEKVERQKLEDVDSSTTLSHQSLLRNASSAVVTSASALVSQCLMTLNELSTLYVKETYNLVKLYHEYNSIAGQKLGTLEDDLWQDIIETRAKLDDQKRAMQEVQSVLSSSLQVLQSAGEAAYRAGVEYSAVEAKTKHQQATDYLSLIQSDSRKAERELTKIQAKNIKETVKEDDEMR